MWVKTSVRGDDISSHGTYGRETSVYVYDNISFSPSAISAAAAGGRRESSWD